MNLEVNKSDKKLFEDKNRWEDEAISNIMI